MDSRNGAELESGRQSARYPTWSRDASSIDPASPSFHASVDRFDVWRAAREAHPVAWTVSAEYGEFWSVTSHALAQDVLRNAVVFGSAKGMRLGGNPRAVALASGKMLVVTDGAAHRRLRGAHSAWLSSSSINRISSQIERDIHVLIGDLVKSGSAFDAVAQFGSVVARQVLGRVLGIPENDWNELGRMTDAAYATNDAVESAQAHGDLFMYLYTLLEQRRVEPQDDFVTALARAIVDGRTLTDDEILLNCDGMLSGGLETTPLAIAGALAAFAEDPECWERLRAEPDLTDSAVEEILRWTSPPAHVMRTALADFALGDAMVRRGDRVVVWIPSANRDEAVFVDGDRFVLGRERNPHLSFGGGPHYCIGAVLARLELRCVLAVLTQTVSSITLAGEQRFRQSNFLHGHEILEVALTPDGTARNSGDC